jgi:hypothetical protein
MTKSNLLNEKNFKWTKEKQVMGLEESGSNLPAEEVDFLPAWNLCARLGSVADTCFPK